MTGVRAYVINLPRSTERRAHMQRQLARAGLEHELVEAVDGYALTPGDRARLVDEDAVSRFPAWLTPGAIGCTLSHLRVYERIAAESLPHALVLEDDCVFGPGIGELTGALATELATDEAMLLYFRSFEPARLRRSDAVSVGAHQVLSPADPAQILSAVAYLIGADAARSIVAASSRVSRAADSWNELIEVGALGRLRCVYPCAVTHASSLDSTFSRDRAGTLTHRLAAPLPRLRELNRRRIQRRMSRVRLVD